MIMENQTQSRRFPRVFWIANFMELFERWAYYGVFALLSVYLTDPGSSGGLGFTSAQSGLLMGTIMFLIYLLPIVTGAFADRLGYKKMMVVAFIILAAGYFLMGQFSSYHGVFLAFLLVGIGAAIFKPVIVGTISKATNITNATIGFGIFYMIVNVGGFIGPYVGSRLRDVNWQYIFIMSAAVIALNIIPLLLFYKEPGRELRQMKSSLGDKFAEIGNNLVTALSDIKFLVFVVIMSGFWVMYMQIFFTLPVYITQWVDTRTIYNASPWIAWIIGTNVDGVGIIRPEMLQNLGAASIVFFQVLMSNLVKGIAPIRSITLGILISAIAMTCMSLGINGWIIVVAIFFFAIGEMISSPRTQEYVSRIAPPDKVGVYMGFSFLPVAFGNFIGGFVYGRVYGSMANLYGFIVEELDKKGFANAEALSELNQDQILAIGMEYLNMDVFELKAHLFEVYQPFKIWWVFGAIGLATVLMFLIFNRFIKR
jgi:proton-dependent oligopeptide transporter, POT family